MNSLPGASRTLLLLASTCLLLACGAEPPPESDFSAVDFGGPTPSTCDQDVPTRQALFGDLHVHTAYSNDAWNFGVRVYPDGAYRYAFGEEVRLPLGDDLQARSVRIDRPLDFAAVTDHAEFFGEQAICYDPDSAGYNAKFCEVMRSGNGRAPQLVMRIAAPISMRDEKVCGEGNRDCARENEKIWRSSIEAAQRWNDSSSACQRTTFIAYEYSSLRMGSNLHRNVIFRNSVAPNRPVSYLDATREWELWRILKERCLDSNLGCDVLAIPHNSNISNGRMFAIDYPGLSSAAEQAARARLRAQVEPLVEIMQHKGDSECRNDLEGVLGAVDEICDEEKFESFAHQSIAGEGAILEQCYEGPLADWLPRLGPRCVDRKSYVRYALIEGLREEQRLGVNPYKFGIMASTDTHNGLAGGVREFDYPGHLGQEDATAVQRVQFSKAIAGNASNSPGGLIGVWANQNSRDSIFDAMQRKEVFGTSGPRIQPRFFGSWELSPDLCQDSAMLDRAYRQAVPMGSDLPPRQSAAPAFLVAAAADGGTMRSPGMPLQRLQVIKGWADTEGNHHQRIFDVAGDADNGASVDPQTCEASGAGFQQLCTVWRDPDFDADVAAVYYLRALENPSCRYNTRQCLAIPPGERPDDCREPFFDPLIQERAWSSPIWYTPAG